MTESESIANKEPNISVKLNYFQCGLLVMLIDAFHRESGLHEDLPKIRTAILDAATEAGER